MNQDFLCGPCTQTNQLSLETRIALAVSVKRGQQYVCSQCSLIIILPVYSARASDAEGLTDTLEIAPERAAETATTGIIDTTMTAKSDTNVEQLEFFQL